MSVNRHNARQAVVQALYQWDITKQDSQDIESSFLRIHDMQNVDKKYFRQLMADIPTKVADLEQQITPHIDRDFASLDPIEKAILRLGAYELGCKKDVPTKVVINEMIELAKTFGADHSYKFVNGVMDKLAKDLRD